MTGLLSSLRNSLSWNVPVKLMLLISPFFTTNFNPLVTETGSRSTAYFFTRIAVEGRGLMNWLSNQLNADETTQGVILKKIAPVLQYPRHIFVPEDSLLNNYTYCYAVNNSLIAHLQSDSLFTIAPLTLDFSARFCTGSFSGGCLDGSIDYSFTPDYPESDPSWVEKLQPYSGLNELTAQATESGITQAMLPMVLNRYPYFLNNR